MARRLTSADSRAMWFRHTPWAAAIALREGVRSYNLTIVANVAGGPWTHGGREYILLFLGTKLGIPLLGVMLTINTTRLLVLYAHDVYANK